MIDTRSIYWWLRDNAILEARRLGLPTMSADDSQKLMLTLSLESVNRMKQIGMRNDDPCPVCGLSANNHARHCAVTNLVDEEELLARHKHFGDEFPKDLTVLEITVHELDQTKEAG